LFIISSTRGPAAHAVHSVHLAMKHCSYLANSSSLILKQDTKLQTSSKSTFLGK